MSSDGDWLTFIGIVLATYLAWLGIVIAKFRSLDLLPSELLFKPRTGHRALKDLRRVRPVAFLLAIAPTVAVVALAPKVADDASRLGGSLPSAIGLSTLVTYGALAICAVVGWMRFVAINRRVAALRASERV